MAKVPFEEMARNIVDLALISSKQLLTTFNPTFNLSKLIREKMEENQQISSEQAATGIRQYLGIRTFSRVFGIRKEQGGKTDTRTKIVIF